MANSSLIFKVLSISPHFEMFFRRVYWANVGWLSKRARKARKAKKVPANIKLPLNFDRIHQFLRENGVHKDTLAVVHSAYAPFNGRGKSPDELIDFLLEVLGEGGTLAMPAMPVFKGAPSVENYLKSDLNDTTYIYDVKKSRIKTGMLSSCLNKRAESVRSRHPINTMVALGPLALNLMDGNLSGDSPLPCGTNSSWKRCVDHDAIIIGLGTDLTHSLTMIHVAEDVLDGQWSVGGWYLEKKFRIKEGDLVEERVLRERAPKWGALHYGERTLCKDLINAGLLKSVTIDGVIIEILKARELIDFLNTKNKNGYPYFWVNR